MTHAPDCAGPPRRGRRAPPGPDGVPDLSAARIQRALQRRTRYRYVSPRVLPEGEGWKVLSPNCSRNVDPQGGEIAIAWLQPAAGGLWLLHARDHARQAWRLAAGPGPLPAVLALLCSDADRVFWP